MDEQHPQEGPVIEQQPIAGANQSWAEISGQNTASSKGHRPVRLLFIVPLVILLAAGVWYGVNKYNKSHSFASKIRNDAGASNIPKARAATTDTPFGQIARGSGGADGIAIKVGQVVPGPKTTGDAPDAGTAYLEIDISASNNTKSLMIVPGTFYYQAGSGKLITTATSTGNPKVYPNKDVRIVGKEPLEDLSLPAGGSDNSHYLIFQIPSGDKSGKLIWYDGYYDTKSTELAVFDLT